MYPVNYNKLWSEQDNMLLAKLKHDKVPTKKIAKHLGRQPHAVDVQWNKISSRYKVVDVQKHQPIQSGYTNQATNLYFTAHGTKVQPTTIYVCTSGKEYVETNDGSVFPKEHLDQVIEIKTF